MNNIKKVRVYNRCKICNNKFYDKKEYINHKIVCNIRQTSSESNNITQLCNIIERLSNKCHVLESKIHESTKPAVNTSDIIVSLPPSSTTFDEFVNNINVSVEYIDIVCKTKNIHDIFMQLFNEYLYTYKNKDIPIKTITKKVFVYKNDKWTTICSSNIISIVKSFLNQLLRKTNEWILYHTQDSDSSSIDVNDYNIMIIKLLDLNISSHSKIVKSFRQVLISYN